MNKKRLTSYSLNILTCSLTSRVTLLYSVTCSMNFQFSKYSDLYFDLPCDIDVLCELLHGLPIISILCLVTSCVKMIYL